MAGKGDKPRPVNGSKYRDNYDKIFRKQDAYAWCKEIYGCDLFEKVLDPDGWRYNDGVGFETLISREDFARRISESTCYCRARK